MKHHTCALLAVGFVAAAVATLFLHADERESGSPETIGINDPSESAHRDGHVDVPPPFLGRAEAEAMPPHHSLIGGGEGRIFRRRRLQKIASRKSPMLDGTDEKTIHNHRGEYLGGMRPAMDERGLPAFLRDVAYPIDDSEVVHFWHIPKASGTTMKHILNYCYGLTRAENMRGEPSMKYVQPRVVNMDTASQVGMQHALDEKLVDSGKIDVMVSNYFLAGSALFNADHPGRSFAIIRHPIDLAVSLFFYRRIATWEPSYRGDWEERFPTFSSYVSSKFYVGNWMVRQLTGTMAHVELKESHLEHAKLILREKIFVGIASEMDESMRQFQAYFGWNEEKSGCVRDYVHGKHGKSTNANRHPKVTRKFIGWEIAIEKEKWDMGLYYSALGLFAAQRERFPP